MNTHKLESPTPEEIKEARKRAGLTQTQAAALVHTTCRVWQQWEATPDVASHQKMHPAFWELFCLKATRRLTIDPAL